MYDTPGLNYIVLVIVSYCGAIRKPAFLSSVTRAWHRDIIISPRFFSLTLHRFSSYICELL